MPLATQRLLRRLLPFLAWRRQLDAATLRTDLLAGVTVALVAIPQALAYAQLAGLPAYVGLYASLLPSIVAALFGSSPQLNTGPVALTSLLTAAALAPLALPGSDTWLVLAVQLALLSGLLQLAFGVLRLAHFADLLSHPVLHGFINACSVLICLAQLPALLRRLEWQRGPDRWSMIATTDFLARSFTWRWPGLAAARGLGLAALQALPPLKSALARQMMFGRR